jgi:PAS domain S-box-containing protein
MNASTDRPSDIERQLALLVETGLLLSKSHELAATAQSAVDVGLQLCGAQFGAFFYTPVTEGTESRLLHVLSGFDHPQLESSPRLHDATALAACFDGTKIVRSADITKNSRYWKTSPFQHMSIRSYLAVPVCRQADEILGGLFFGHTKAGVFTSDSERLIATIAAQAAIALENVRLRHELTDKIGDLERARDRKRDSAKRLGELAAIVESSDDAILSKDLNGIITSWNQAAARILGYTADEIVGKSILTLIPEHLHSDEKIIIAKIKAGERIEHFETLRRHKSGELIDVSLTVSPIKDENGTIIGASKVLRDVSSKKRLEMSLVQAEKIAATGRMAATIAHEINNPLEAVLNLLYLLRNKVSDTDGITYLQTAESELNRVSQIAKQTLGYYREHASVAQASLSDIAEHAITIYAPRCTAAGIHIEKRLNSTKKVALRRGEMMQTISNLIANAIYAMPYGGALRISTYDTEDPEEGIILAIEDNGVGIPPENLSRIFDAFFTTRLTIGTGIGLFVAKQFVEGHGGSIRVHSSTDPGTHGTTLWMFLPRETTYESKPE